MAILKHGSIKNGDYGEAQRYLLFEHDSETQKPLRDEQGNMIMRKGYIQSGLNCDPFTFNTECTELNRGFKKNQGRKDVKAHHYILSFAPEDASEHGLTPQRAHAIAEEFARRFFAGHQVLMVTHTDGHNHSSNIHTHMVLNSVRKENVDWQDYMERPPDALAGYKHHQSRELLRRMQQSVNEICEREHLTMVDYTLPTEKKTTDREYRAKRDGQEKLEEVNKAVRAAGLHPRRTEYDTIKDKIREAVDATVKETSSEADFLYMLRERYRVAIKVSRGRWSYIHEDRAKPIRNRSIGRTYDRESVLKRLQGFRDMPENVPPEYAALPKIFLLHSQLRLVTDLQTCVKAQQSRAYARKVTISNLQRMAETVAYIQENGIGTRKRLEELCRDTDERLETASSRLQADQQSLGQVNESIHYLGVYLSGKKTYEAFLETTEKGKFRNENQLEIREYERAREWLNRQYGEKPFPSMKQLKKDKGELTKIIREDQRNMFVISRQKKKLDTVWQNVRLIFNSLDRAIDETTG